MKVGIISDTHDDVTNTNKAIDIFEQNNVGVIIHAGDIISPPILKEFRRLTEINVKIFGVFGNNDGEKNGLKDAFEWINGKLLWDVGKIEIDGLKFGIYHGDNIKKKEKMIKSGKFDVFIYGHSHTKDPKNGTLDSSEKTIVLNPGTAHSKAQSYYSPPYFRESSILIFDTELRDVKFLSL